LNNLSIVRQFNKEDQALRKNTDPSLSLDTKRELDSLLQVPFKKLVSEKEHISIEFMSALSLLLRHVGPDYIEEFKEMGMLDHYALAGLYSYEKYYSAFDYKHGTHYTSFYGPQNERSTFDINQRRKVMELLPLHFSPHYIATEVLRMDDQKITRPEKIEKGKEIIEYVKTYYD